MHVTIQLITDLWSNIPIQVVMIGASLLHFHLFLDDIQLNGQQAGSYPMFVWSKTNPEQWIYSHIYCIN